jgi:simple sugar transport system permease protein
MPFRYPRLSAKSPDMSWPSLIPLTLTSSTALLLAATGGLFSELAGVINFALEGMMLAGAFSAVWGSHVFGTPWAGVLAGMVAGMLIGGLHGVACLVLRANQVVASMALNLLAAGLTGMMLHEIFGVYGTSPEVAALPKIGRLWGAQSFPVPSWLVGFGDLSVMVPIAYATSLAAVVLFRHTSFGLRVRACGENPEAADAGGVHVGRTRFCTLLVSGALAGVAGSTLAIGELAQFVENMTHGRGYLAIAAVILGRWRPSGVLLASLFFGLAGACSEWLAVRWSHFPAQIFLALPYVVSLLVLTRQLGRGRPPSALGR